MLFWEKYSTPKASNDKWTDLGSSQIVRASDRRRLDIDLTLSRRIDVYSYQSMPYGMIQ